MAEIGAELAGEVSGHIFYKDNNCFDDGIYAAVRLLNILGAAEINLSEMMDSIPTMFSTNEGRIDVADERKFKAIEEIKMLVQAEVDADPMCRITINDIDGLRVNTKDGWWLLRASNTQAAIISRCESSSADGLQRLEAEVEKYLYGAGILSGKVPKH
jgi:phosphomannomutase